MKLNRIIMPVVAVATVLAAAGCKRAVKVESSPAPAHPAPVQ